VAEPVTLLAIVKNHSATSIRPVFGTKVLEVRHIAWTRRATHLDLDRKEFAFPLNHEITSAPVSVRQ
jgi:hypothetical protein